MKGTLFSADFIKDADANLRLLEINTDSGFITNTLSSRFDFTDFISILQSNNITELVLVYKAFQQEFIEVLKTTIGTDATFITTVTEQVEDKNTIYPANVTDSSEKFILRLAYDENALLDSTYCKQRANLQKLFYDNSATGSIPEFYYSGSEYEVNTLRSNINDHATLPDFVSKPKSEAHSALVFYNIGCSESSSAERTTRLVSHSDIDYGVNTIEKFHYNLDDLNNNNRMSGYRVVGIVYGTDINYVNIGEWKVESFFEIPTIPEINYITNNDGVPSVIEDFEVTLDDGALIAEGTTVSQSSIAGKKCMKIVTTTTGNKWQSGQLSFQNGDLDLTTSNKLVQIEVYSEVPTWILAKAVQSQNGGPESATHASHGGSGWETIDFNFSEPHDNTPVANDVYGRILFFPLWYGAGYSDVAVTTTYYKTITALRYTHDDYFINFYKDRHYFQLTSNWLRATDDNGMFVGQSVLNADNTSGPIELLQQNDVVKSIFINGLPDGDVQTMYDSWSSSGTTLPSGSYVTSSIVQTLSELTINRSYGIVGELKVSETDAIYSTIGKNYLVYSTGSNEMSFKGQFTIDSADDFLVDPSGSLIPIISNKVVILESNETGSLYKLDVETLDMYFVSSSVAPFVVHNGFCFIAGTQITLPDWTTKNIEDVVVGDVVISFNEETGKQEDKEVLSLLSPLHDDLVKYTFSNGNVITSTFDHPYYVNGLQLASYRPEWTNERYDELSGVIEIKVGDVVNLEANDESSAHIISIEEQPREATQTYIFHVKDNMNFYANGILTHNKEAPTCFLAGTEISLSNGDVKNIEDVIVGDAVESYIESIHKNETIGRYESGIVTAIDHRHNVGSHADACNSLGDTTGVYSLNNGELMFTPEHPFLTKRGWASLVPISTQEPYLSQQDEELILSIGDFIIEDGKWVEIKTIEHHPMDVDTPVYNITVDVHHNYIANNIVVHNK